ncbi:MULTISPECIES: hypothetical protein [unclassified Nitrospina]|uniref:hypothetical protein n=1 Tax=unclassified Nitrospina TaxID=2638683 RepID=UPI003F9D08F6
MKAKRIKIILLVVGGVVYAVWAWRGPIQSLELKYGESGLTWGLLVFGVLIPYLVYFITGLFKPDTPKE